MEFKKHEVTRPAEPEEQADIMKRLLDVLNDIDTVKQEAKDVAKTYREQVEGLEFRKHGLRLNLENGTVTQEVEVHAVANENLGVMQYFDRDGTLIDSLTHALSNKDAEEAAAKRQLGLFGEPEKLAEHLTSEMQKVFGDDVTVTVEAEQADSATLAELQDNAENGSPDRENYFDPADLDQLQANAEEAGTLPERRTAEKPVKKEKKKPELVAA